MSVKVAGKQLSSGQYQVTDKHLVIESLPSGNFDVEIEVDVKPKENTSLEGLYNSSGTFCTQCEAEGFRGITYFYDRWGYHTNKPSLTRLALHKLSMCIQQNLLFVVLS